MINGTITTPVAGMNVPIEFMGDSQLAVISR